MRVCVGVAVSISAKFIECQRLVTKKRGCFVSSWQFPKGDVPLWVRNAMEAAKIDITGVCDVGSREHEITEV